MTTLHEHVDLYLRKSGCDDPLLNEDLLFVYEEGFFTVECRTDCLMVLTAAGDGKFIDKKVIELAKKLGYKKIVFPSKRNPKAWERRLGYKLAGYVMEKEI